MPGMSDAEQGVVDKKSYISDSVIEIDVEAIRQGVMNGIAFEIEGYIARLFPEIDALSIIFTGGDAKFFVKRIKNTIFAHCDLVFLGLNRILEYNASEESRR